MGKSNKTQLLILSLIVTLLSLTPVFSSSFRPTYLYLIINVLIVAIAAEAKFLSSSSSSSSSLTSNKSLEGDKKNTTSSSNIIVTTKTSYFSSKTNIESSMSDNQISVSTDEVKKMVKKCPSTPSVFYIESGNESEAEAEEDVQDEEEYEEEELFVKAETFIGNFYNQLKMQREESWNN